MNDKLKYGYGHDPCFHCDKVYDPLIGVTVIDLQEYRQTTNVSVDYDTVRVTLDFNLKNNKPLYNRLRNMLRDGE